MRDHPMTLWMPRLAVAGVLALPVWGASGQTRVVADAETLDTGRAQTVVVTQRPLRTFRGETVRIGRYADSEKEIGVVRPLREVPGSYRTRGFDRGFGSAYRSYDSLGRPARVCVDSYGYSPRVEREIGVVRPFITHHPPVRNLPQSFTNPTPAPGIGNASSGNQTGLGDETDRALRASSVVRPVSPENLDDLEITAVEAVELPAAHRDDPWALLDRGYYREARQRFAQTGTLDDTATRTGHALAAALSGDLAGGAALMPADPALPDGVTLSVATAQRLAQIAEYLYGDNLAMQAGIQAVLAPASPIAASAN